MSASLSLCFSLPSEGQFTGTPPTYGYDADRAEEQRRHHEMMPYIDDSPSSSPHLSSKSRSSRDTLSSGSLESAKYVSLSPHHDTLGQTFRLTPSVKKGLV